MHDDRRIIESRIRKLLDRVIRPALYSAARPLTLSAWHVDGEPVPVADALDADYEPFTLGATWGGPWATTWMRASAEIPEEWSGRRVEAVFDLGFDLTKGPGGQAEGLVHDAHGAPLQGLHPYSRSVLLAGSATGGDRVDLLIELAANPPIVASAGLHIHHGSPETAGTAHLYRLEQAELAVREDEVWHLIHDIEVLDELMRELPLGSSRRHEILHALRRAADAVVPGDVVNTAAGARRRLADVLSRPAHASAHTLSAVGHAHIDSAWLWPVRETVRKCARTFTNMTTLAQEYPELVFACSSAQQYAWMKEQRPEIFARMKKAAAKGNWAPVGGMWVEADGNLPGGEALARQLVHGRRFFAEEFGVEQHGVWLPDSFGYTAAYPQLAKLAGARWFLTQKLSWNETNRLPHHSFDWEGIDGTRIFTHFPPVDSYNASLTAGELAHAESNFADKGVATRSLVPFGHGDGGGGPTRSMLEKARRLRDLEGSPRVVVEAPDTFFAAARAERGQLPVWRGELYLENHRGTYTSQARTKRGNRRGEALLREAELWAATAAVRAGAPYPYERLESLWRRVLFNQFHDILPGSSIAWVHRQAEREYAQIHAELEALIADAVGHLPGGPAFLNAGPYARREVAIVAGHTDTTDTADGGFVGAQRLSDGRTAVLAEVAPLASGGAADAPRGTVTAKARDGGFVLDNGSLTVVVDRRGLLTSVYDRSARREAIAPGAAGNLLQLHPDDPNMWSAWNIDSYYRDTVRDLDEAESVTLVDGGPLLASVRVERAHGASRFVQHIELTAESRQVSVRNDIDWQERDTVLKAAWPLDVHAERESAEIQFGHVQRPTHENTSWDAARFELWAHRWVHVGERHWGAALLNDSTYGHDVRRGTREGGGTTTTVRLSLLRSPHSPDPQADRGRHSFGYALLAGAGIEEAIAGGYALNLPLRPARADARSLVEIDTTDVVVESVKLADDRSGDVMVRLYEACGGTVRARLSAGFPLAAVFECDLLERPERELAHPSAEGTVDLRFRPFQIRTVRLQATVEEVAAPDPSGG
ncbi:glycoside hydrolase family 38 C-terminal domain-containing protein [Streptomyces sp. NP-1717]|uniref:alpha-mannosidase n=1 Tax=Streptomyces sp. NP-1717 TaxID=2704470 RepID=UPI001F5E1758|nr:glycoside hydrolase family 38 C-terminal domain-containing protein [Streptomyces sp. NP-1717]MCI3223761.1 alpha-mannosidase [Streptomyces sp. NP-1717]